MSRPLRSLLAVAVSFGAPALDTSAQDLGGGGQASHGRVPRFVLESWLPGAPSAFRFDDLPPTAVNQWGAVGFASRAQTFSFVSGTVLVDLAQTVVFPMGPRAALPPLPAASGPLYLQGFVLDAAAGLLVTDASRVELFDPVTVTADLGNVCRLDETVMTFDACVSNSGSGRIEFTPDRTRAYVVEVAAAGQVEAFRVTGGGLTRLLTISLSGGSRPGGAITADGTRLYVPLHDGIAEVDIDPGSATYHRELRKIPVPITGPAAAVGSGPLAVAVMPDASRLYVAYGEALPASGNASLGMLDLTQPGTPHVLIPLTAGGNLFGVHTLEDVVIDPRGEFVYTVEFGVDPALPGVSGYAQGGVVSVVSTLANAEILTIDTLGYEARHLEIDALGRSLWLAHKDANGIAQAVRVDIDRRSQTQWTVQQTIPLSSTPFHGAGDGPNSVAVTPAGDTVLVGMAQGNGNPSEIVRVDALAGVVSGRVAARSTWSRRVAVQR